MAISDFCCFYNWFRPKMGTGEIQTSDSHTTSRTVVLVICSCTHKILPLGMRVICLRHRGVIDSISLQINNLKTKYHYLKHFFRIIGNSNKISCFTFDTNRRILDGKIGGNLSKFLAAKLRPVFQSGDTRGNVAHLRCAYTPPLDYCVLINVIRSIRLQECEIRYHQLLPGY